MSDGGLALRAGVATAWANAWLAGRASLDDASTHASRVCRTEGVRGVPDEPGPVAWAVALGRLRAAGVRHFQLALPLPGDPLGVVGPAPLLAEVVARGAAIVGVAEVGSLVVVPPAAPATYWTVHAVDRAPALDATGDARRMLLETIGEASAGLERLDVARPDPDAAASLADLDRTLRDLDLPPGMTGRDAQVIVTAARTAAAVTAARRGPGGATSSTQAGLRDEQLRPLEQATRRALVAVFSRPVVQ